MPSAVSCGGPSPRLLSARPSSTAAIIWASTRWRFSSALGPAPSVSTITSRPVPCSCSRKPSSTVSPARILDRQRTLTLICRHHDRSDTTDSLIERREKTVFAVLELLVERAPRNTRARYNTRDRGITRATLRSDVHHRREYPSALYPRDLPTSQTIRPRRQPIQQTLADCWVSPEKRSRRHHNPPRSNPRTRSTLRHPAQTPPIASRRPSSCRPPRDACPYPYVRSPSSSCASGSL